MSTDNNASDDDTSLFDIGTQQFYAIQFWVFLLLVILSILGSFFALYHFLFDRALRQALHNHVIIIILIIDLFYNCTDIVLYIHYFRSFQSFVPSPSLRLFWGYIDWAITVLQVNLYAWVTVERHILIFHDHLLSTRKKRLFIHILPPIIIIIYHLLYYTLVFFAGQCQNYLDNLAMPSMFPCALENNALAMYEILINEIFPVFIIVISSVVLLLRVLWQRYRAHQHIHWRRYRKMTIQVLSISSVYAIFLFPYQLIIFFHICGMPADIGADFLSHWLFCTYYSSLLFPIIAIESLPKLKEKLKNILHRRRQQRLIAPATLLIVRMIDNRVIIQ